ncbi:MAG: sulfotransferase [Caulobacterales bacterium]
MRSDIRAARERYSKIEASLRSLEEAARLAPDLPPDDPIFLCAIGWRSGSTLLQRILMTDPRIFVWGEPLDHLGVLSRLTDLTSLIGPDWPPSYYWLTHRPGVNRTADFVTNLSPDASDFRAGLRGLFDRWLAEPARRDGFARWGVKETRWSGEQARLLRWLYPSARFVVIARHPVACYASMKVLGLEARGPGFWVRRPDRRLNGLKDYASYWNELALSWAEASEPLDATVIRYEDITAGRVDLAGLGRRLDLALDPDLALGVVAGATPDKRPISAQETERVNALTAEGRRAFGYGD